MRYALFVLLLLQSCSPSDGGGQGVSAPVQIELDGDWVGTWTSNNGTDSGSISLDLFYQNPTLGGSGGMTQSSCFFFIGIMGTVDENARVATGEITNSAGDRISYRVTVSNDSLSISGTYEVLTGACMFDTGTLSLSLVPSPPPQELGATPPKLLIYLPISSRLVVLPTAPTTEAHRQSW